MTVNYYAANVDCTLGRLSKKQLSEFRDQAVEIEDWRTVDEIDAHERLVEPTPESEAFEAMFNKNSYTRQTAILSMTRRLIPAGGIGKDIRSILSDVIDHKSADPSADIKLALNALDGFDAFGWGREAKALLVHAFEGAEP